jgi:methionyl-tRNA formyltransferase
MIPPKAITINIHHGLAPYYRGCRCVEQALLQSDILNLGVTLHQLSEKIDAGNIYVQKRITYEQEDTRETVHQKILLAAISLLIQIIHGTLSGKSYISTPQNIKRGKLYLIKEWNKSKQKLLAKKDICKPSLKAKYALENLTEKKNLY